jgi:hypothetical protein
MARLRRGNSSHRIARRPAGLDGHGTADVHAKVDERTIVKAQLSLPVSDGPQSVCVYSKDRTLSHVFFDDAVVALFEPGEWKMFLNVLWRGATDGMLVIEGRAEWQDW